MRSTQQILTAARSGSRIRFNQRAASRNLRRKMVKAGQSSSYIRKNLNKQVQKYRKITQTKVAKHQAKQAQQATVASAAKKILAARLAYGAFTRLSAPLHNLARIGRWQ